MCLGTSHPHHSEAGTARPICSAISGAACRQLHASAYSGPRIFFSVLIFWRGRAGLGKKAQEAVVHTTRALARSEGPTAPFPRRLHAECLGPSSGEQALDRDWTIWGLGWMPRVEG